MRKFSDYLRQVGRIELPALPFGNEAAESRLVWLTEEEIQQLFKATYVPVDTIRKQAVRLSMSDGLAEALQARDRAMLAVFYGCGLRRNEGVHLDVGDIHFDRALLHVRKGKNYRERLVPVSKTSLKYLQEYVYDHRPELTRSNNTGRGAIEALFISYNHGTRMQGQSMAIRLKVLQHLSEDSDLQQKEIGLHTLRHSIATHLLVYSGAFDPLIRGC